MQFAVDPPIDLDQALRRDGSYNFQSLGDNGSTILDPNILYPPDEK